MMDTAASIVRPRARASAESTREARPAIIIGHPRPRTLFGGLARSSQPRLVLGPLFHVEGLRASASPSASASSRPFDPHDASSLLTHLCLLLRRCLKPHRSRVSRGSPRPTRPAAVASNASTAAIDADTVRKDEDECIVGEDRADDASTRIVLDDVCPVHIFGRLGGPVDRRPTRHHPSSSIHPLGRRDAWRRALGKNKNSDNASHQFLCLASVRVGLTVAFFLRASCYHSTLPRGTYGRGNTPVFTHGLGCKMWDTEGKEYLDFTAGIAVNCLGHSDPAWVAAVTEQAGKLCHVSNLYHTEPGATLARRLVDTSFADRVFYCNSGTEANEGAIKFARKYQMTKAKEAGETEWATETVSFANCFHGRTLGALNLTWWGGTQ